MILDKNLLDSLLEQAAASPRLRQNFDLRTSAADTSQRMLNALQPATQVPIHQHLETTETVVCLCGRLEEIYYEPVEAADGAGQPTFKEIGRELLCPAEGLYGLQIPVGVWHTIRVLEPSVIFEAKDGAYQPRPA